MNKTRRNKARRRRVAKRRRVFVFSRDIHRLLGATAHVLPADYFDRLIPRMRLDQIPPQSGEFSEG